MGLLAITGGIILALILLPIAFAAVGLIFQLLGWLIRLPFVVVEKIIKALKS